MTHPTISMEPFPYIRSTSKGTISILDVLDHCGIKHSRALWKRFVKANPKLTQSYELFQFPGIGQRPTPVALPETVANLLITIPRTHLKETVCHNLTNMKDWLLEVIAQVEQDQMTFEDVLRQSSAGSPDDVATRRWKARRRRAKQSNKILNGVIRSHKADCFREVAALNIHALTGLTSQELRASRAVDNTRDGMSPIELGFLSVAEDLEAQAIQNRHAFGNQAVLSLVGAITKDLKYLKSKYA